MSELDKLKLNIPQGGGPLWAPPDDFVPESKKDKDWFTSYSRYIVGTYYNQSRQPFSLTDIPLRGFAEEAIYNWSYVQQAQANDTYKFITQDYSGAALPAVWVAGGEIRSFFNHLSGILHSGIENVEVTAKNLSSGVASYKAELLEKLLVKWEVDRIAKDILPEGVTFDPVNDPSADLSGPAEIEKYVQSWQDKYAILTEKIGRHQIIADDLKEKFLRDGQHQFAGGISGILTEVVSGRVTNTVISNYEMIWDNRQDDPLGEKSMLCGYVKHNVPYLEVIRKYQHCMDKDDVEELRALAASGYSNIDEFVNYYNQGFGVGSRFNWWSNAGTSNMTLGEATVWFIAPRDFRYKDSTNRYGAKRTMKIKDDKEYSFDGKTVKGVEVSGDYSGFDLYTATLIGNRYIVNYGLANNVLRKHDKKGKPLLPINTFCSNMVLNQGKSVVSSLVQKQDELDMLAYKIREKVANDWGRNYVFNGNKFPGREPTDVANELKNLHVTISVPSGEADDPYAAQRLIEPVDMTLDANIIRYIELRREIMSEMEIITSVSKIALGQQGDVVGKGVQENTIDRNSLGTKTLMAGLMKHFNMVLQYNVNLKQLLYQFKDTVEETLIIGDEGSFLLKLLDPKEFGTQVLEVYLDIADALDPQMRFELRTIALSQAQNNNLDLVDYLKNILKAPTMLQAIKGLEDARNKKDRQLKEQAAMENQMATEQSLASIEAQGLTQAALLQLKEDNANFRAELQATTKYLELLKQKLQEDPPISPLQGQLAAASQPQQQPV